MGVLIVLGVVITGGFMFRWLRNVVDGWTAEAREKTDGSVIRYIRGDFLDPRKCRVEWGWKDSMQVGHTASFIVKFYTNNGYPYPISTSNNVSVQIISPSNVNNVVAVTEFLKPVTNNPRDVPNSVKVSFVVSKSGVYEIAVTQNNVAIAKSPFTKTFLPGPLSAEHTILTRTSHAALSVVVMTIEKNHRLMIDARDQFRNKCTETMDKRELNEKFSLRVKEAAAPFQYPAFTWEIRPSGNYLALDTTMYQVGCYKALLSYEGEEIKNGNFDILVLNSSEADEVETNVSKKNSNIWFECRLLPDYDCDEDNVEASMEGPSRLNRLKSTGELFSFSRKSDLNRSKSQILSPGKLRKVYFYITPKQLVIKEFYLKVFPKKLFAFRLSPSTKILCGSTDNVSGLPTIVINDGVQTKVVLGCSKRNILAATFVGIMYSNMGGHSNTFEEKLSHFNQQLITHHKINIIHQSRDKAELCIDRSNLLMSSFLATKNLSLSDWKNQFVISFKNEMGIDWGGVSREWFHLLCKALFDPQSETPSSGGCGLFRAMKEDDPQALVLPNPSGVSGFKLKFYEFAGRVVGKCMLESAIGGEYAQQVSARFARSFLAQLIGLPITYTYFESDDPELYTSKVNYILDNDIDEMELTFSEEVYNSTGSLETVVDLVPNGSTLSVTNLNKRQYLNKFANYRLCDAIKEEVEHFTKGLFSLVPDHMLSVFDENELELAMCGCSQISLEDMKKNADVSCLNTLIAQWFWAIMSSFTQEDMARLLQFTTGCSQLPPDGFKALTPPFKISSSEYHTSGMLPTSHTCFNELCIPTYESYEDLHRLLRIAITEGSTGFGLT